MKSHSTFALLLLFLTITQPALFFIINGIENINELASHSNSFQSSLEDSLGLDLDKFEPGKRYDINGANFTVGEQDILVKPDEGVKYIKFGLQAIGDKAALFGGLAPVGIIEHLPANEKIKVVGFDNVVEIELENTNGGLTKSITVNLNGETVINKADEMSVMVFVEINEEQDLKISFRDSEDKKIKITEDLKTGEETFGDQEVQLFEFERDQIPNFKGIGSKAGAMIKKLSKKDLEDLKNAKAGPKEDEQRNTIDIIVFEREVVVMQDGSNIGSFVLEAQTVLKFLDKDEETIQVVLTPKGLTGIKGDVLLSGEHIGSKTGKSQLEIKIKLSLDGIELDMEADKIEIEELGVKMTKEKKVYPRDYLIYKQL